MDQWYMIGPHSLTVIAQFFPLYTQSFYGEVPKRRKCILQPLSQKMKGNLREHEATETCTVHGSETKNEAY